MPETDERHSPPDVLPKILRFGAAARYIGLSRQQVKKLRAAGDFPQPIRLSERALAWYISDLDAWVDSRPRGEQPKAAAG